MNDLLIESFTKTPKNEESKKGAHPKAKQNLHTTNATLAHLIEFAQDTLCKLSYVSSC